MKLEEMRWPVFIESFYKVVTGINVLLVHHDFENRITLTEKSVYHKILQMIYE